MISFIIWNKYEDLNLPISTASRWSIAGVRGASIFNASGLSYSFKVLIDELLKAHFSGEKLSDTEKKNPKMQHLIENVLNEDILNQMILWRIKFVPFVKSSS